MSLHTESIHGWLEDCRRWSEEALRRSVPPRDATPTHLHQAIHHALFSGGKRLRPALLRTVCRALAGADAAAEAPACALELVHTYSLVHDDLPCMDDDELRRGRPTVHVAFDEATAVLAGDGLLTRAFGLLAERGGEHAPALVEILAAASGTQGMVGGQSIDLTLELESGEASGELDLERVGQLHAWKTAALFGAAAEMGAVVAGSGRAQRRAVKAFGLELGLLFQAVDDVLDVVGDAATLGKTPGKDETHARSTLVAVLGLEAARAHTERLAERVQEQARGIGWGPGEPAFELVGYLRRRQT